MTGLSPWVTFSLLSAVTYGLSSTLIFYTSTHFHEMNMTAFMVAVYVVSAVLCIALWFLPAVTERWLLTHGYKKGVMYILHDPKMLALVAISAVATVGANVLLYTAYQSAPNPGLCDTISSLDAFVSLGLSVLFFGGAVSSTNFVGMVLMAIAGYFILVKKTL
jgi:uncharacterized membrane protein